MKKFLLGIFLFVTALNSVTSASRAGKYIEVMKQGVLYKFVHFDADTDHFTRDNFANWESETFKVFDQVKDQQAIAIDLGAWIGTTSIWLSHNFAHVISVDADPVSLDCLKQNLTASDCHNVSICSRPVANTSRNVIFGSRKLNESTSQIKPNSNATDDIMVKSITFKQLIHDYIYANDRLKDKKIAFIKCDIEGGEEEILEDLLHFAYHNQVKVYLSFHLDWWKSKKISDFKNLFKFFDIQSPESDGYDYIRKNPFGSLLFIPKAKQQQPMFKKNTPAVIIGYNQPTYIKMMVAQLEKYTNDIIIVDNASSFQPLLDYYAHDYKYTLLRQTKNFGHTVYTESFVKNLAGDIFILTDPDIKFNSSLPNNFIDVLIDLSQTFKANKVGFALDIKAKDIRPNIMVVGWTLANWEGMFWKQKLTDLKNPELQLYRADIDTTFSLVNNNFRGNDIRVAGNYTSQHIPWHTNYRDNLLPGEYEAYLSHNNSTTYFKSIKRSILARMAMENFKSLESFKFKSKHFCQLK